MSNGQNNIIEGVDLSPLEISLGEKRALLALEKEQLLESIFKLKKLDTVN
jgi:hypothetical protein